MNKLLLALGIVTLTGITGFLLLGGSQSTDNGLGGQFNEFCRDHSKEYHSLAERAYRLAVFQKNLELISAHNERKDVTWELGLNQFADLTYAEFKEYYLTDMSTHNGSTVDHCAEPGALTTNGPDSVDWRKLGKVQKVKNQGMCGSCWAFSATGALEAAYAIKTGEAPPNLSEQELIECSSSYGNKGCGGGLMQWAYDYIIDHNIHNSQEYPYKSAFGGKCKTDKLGKGKFGVAKCIKAAASIEGLADALVNAPVAVAMFVDPGFMFYRKGIYNPANCKAEPNHGVTAVGFELNSNPPSFHVKNSWGALWGDKGFFQISMGTGSGTCGLSGNGNNYWVEAL